MYYLRVEREEVKKCQSCQHIPEAEAFGEKMLPDGNRPLSDRRSRRCTGPTRGQLVEVEM